MRFKVISFCLISSILFLSYVKNSHKPAIGLNIGDKVPVFSEEQFAELEISKDEIEGKMVLINFWASYDAPSRIENFHKKMILNKYEKKSFYNSEGLVIISISLDRFKAPYFRSIERDELDNFYHVCDFEGKDSKWAKTFSINDEFVSFLVDGDGRVVEKSNDLNKIESTLKRLDSAQIEGLAFGITP